RRPDGLVRRDNTECGETLHLVTRRCSDSNVEGAPTHQAGKDERPARHLGQQKKPETSSAHKSVRRHSGYGGGGISSRRHMEIPPLVVLTGPRLEPQPRAESGRKRPAPAFRVDVPQTFLDKPI